VRKRCYILRIGICAAIIFIIYLVIKPSTEKRLEQLFGITDAVYEVESVDDTLSNFSFGGGYTVVLLVSEDEMEMFLEEIKDSGMYEADEEARKYESRPVKNSFNIALSKDDILYVGMSGVRRKVKPLDFLHLRPRTCGRRMLYSEPEDGIYRVYLDYTE